MKLLFLILFLIFTSSVFAQKLEIRSPLRFLALGDSYTIGQGVQEEDNWPRQFVDRIGELGIITEELKIIAQTGWRTDNLLNAIDAENLEPNYNLVSLLIGVNNQFQGVNFEIYPVEFRTLLETALVLAGGDKSSVFVFSIPDYGYTPIGLSNQELISAQIDKYNKVNREIANEMGIVYFNITPISRQVISKPEYLASDNLHPSGKMYAEWIKLILAGSDVEMMTSNSSNNKKTKTPVVYPNPAQDIITLELPHSATSVSIYNSLGVLIWQRQSTRKDFRIDVSNWEEGVFYYRVRSQNTSNSGKLVISR
jgi:lysophospholipase L1-like esterase